MRFKFLMKQFLQELFFISHCNHHTGGGLQFVFSLPGGIEIKASNMDIQLQDNQFVALRVSGLRNEVPTALPAGDVPTYISSDPAVISIGIDADGVTTVAKALGVAGTATITASADGFTDVANNTVALRPLTGIVLEASAPQTIV